MTLMLRVIRRASALTGLALALLNCGPAQALPSFARQTGSECAACHIGAYGPHLTAFGQLFKMAGYTDTGGDQGAGSVPLSARLRINNINPVQGGSDTRVDEADVYLAGRLMNNVGALVDVRRDDAGNGSVNTYLRNLDLRYVRELKLGDKDALLGLTLNNNPGIQDPIDANMAWGFPAIATDGSLFNPTPGSGQLPGRVLGLTAYTYVDKTWYAEAGAYRTMSRSLQDRLRLDPTAQDPGAMDGIAPYWRLAYIHDFKSQAVSLGWYGMTADKHLSVLSAPGAPRVTERSGPADHYRDVGLDASYLYRGDRSNTWQLRANFVEERRDYGSTPVVFGRTAGGSGKVREATFMATYSFNETWSASAARLRSRTSEDPVRYLNGTADSDLKYYELAWVPFGKEDSWGAPWANLRILAAWLKFDKFNGASNDIFGSRFGGPLVNANDLSSLQISASLTF
ncbi:MAG: cytochrome C [Pseudomonadota bacterium]